MTDFGGVPVKALRENTVTTLDLSMKGLGITEVLVLSGLLPGAALLSELKCAVSNSSH